MPFNLHFIIRTTVHDVGVVDDDDDHAFVLVARSVIGSNEMVFDFAQFFWGGRYGRGMAWHGRAICEQAFVTYVRV